MAQRLMVKKTYKLFIGGKFPRSESGQTALVADKSGKPLAAYCKASKKDFRDAVAQGVEGFVRWKGCTAYLRGQILYRAAEMLEGGAEQLAQALVWHGKSKSAARRGVEEAVDVLVHYAGWADKFQQLTSSVNPVASPHFVFSVPEPTGVIAQINAGGDFVSLISGMARLLSGGNACIAVAGENLSIAASILGEIWHTSDLPAGAIAILTADPSALAQSAASHRAVDGVLGQGLGRELETSIQEAASDTMKRLSFEQAGEGSDSLEGITAFQDIKTTWHPVGW